LSYINRNRARQAGTNRTTQAEISNLARQSFPGRVIALAVAVLAGLAVWAGGSNIAALGQQIITMNRCGVT